MKGRKKINDNFSPPLDSGGKFIIHYAYGDLTEEHISEAKWLKW